MHRQPILERLSDNLKSIGLDPRLLLAFKIHAGLSPDPNWTESDFLIQAYLAAAERFVDEVTGTPYRVRHYKLSLDQICRNDRNRLDRNYHIRLPRYPVNTGVSIDWTADDLSEGTFTEGTDFEVFGPSTLSPEIIFTDLDFQLPSTVETVYPYILTFTAGPGSMAEISQVAIFELAAYYFRNPEAQQEKNPKVGTIFQSNIDMLSNSFL